MERKERSNNRSNINQNFIPQKLPAQVSISLEYNYTIFMYPFQVLATNRMLDSLVSRHPPENIPQIRMFHDFQIIKRVQGLRGMYRGFIPFALDKLMNDFYIESKPQTLEVKRIQIFQTYLNLVMWNPLQIQQTRMQNLDYPIRKFRHSWKEMLKLDNFQMVYRGFCALFLGMLIQQKFLVTGLQISALEPSFKYQQYYSLLSFLIGCIVSHPLFVLSKKVQYHPYFRDAIQKEAYKNTFCAYVYTKQTEGLKGFYRGFVPSMIIYCALYFPYLYILMHRLKEPTKE